ncbi:MAG: YdiU family protein [Paracoccaceae bacterium]|nr:YdiU family protein [Paracoccaceae bacterium]
MTPLPFDNSYARLPDRFFARVRPEPPPDPSLIRLNAELAALMGIDTGWLASPEGLAMLSGRTLPGEADSIAMAYAGHQFGGWVPQLGDGRALLLGEVVGKDGVRRDIQLKGSGRTPFSRAGDGKAPLGPVLREYIVSEAMAALGVPTTRALAAVTTGETVYREGPLPGAVLTRVARSHVRVGTFQYFHARQDRDGVRALADYTLARHYPDAAESARPYLDLFAGVIRRQARLVARWMGFGFIHGVMNTDNTQVAGETIDYGPCAFMEAFHPGMVFSSIDHAGRYAWANQPLIAEWNLARLAETLLPLFDDDPDRALEKARETLARFRPQCSDSMVAIFGRKLGLDENGPENGTFIESTFTTLSSNHVDFTQFFRQLTRIADRDGNDGTPGNNVGRREGDGTASPDNAVDVLRGLFDTATDADHWLAEWRQRIESGTTPRPVRITAMKRENPVLIPRNHRVEEAIRDAMAGDYGPFHRLVEALASPFSDRPAVQDLEQPARPEERVHRTFCGT